MDYRKVLFIPRLSAGVFVEGARNGRLNSVITNDQKCTVQAFYMRDERCLADTNSIRGTIECHRVIHH